MSLTDFKRLCVDQTLTFLWRQWSTLGVLGPSGIEDHWVLDPEALLIHSLEFARYEARLFDQIISWLITNGHWLDVARLRRFMAEFNGSGQANEENTARLCVFGAVIQYLSVNADERKWKNLADLASAIYSKLPQAGSVEPLFKDHSGAFHPLVSSGKDDPSFRLFHLNRPTIVNLKATAEVPINAKSNLRFMLRALLGIGAKSECVLFLLTHDAGRVKEIADETGFFGLTIQQTLQDLSRSGLVSVVPRGRRLEYRASKNRWWSFLALTGPEQLPIPRWLNWGAILGGLSSLHSTLENLTSREHSPYMAMSKLQDSLELIHRQFIVAGLDIPPVPSPGLPPDMHQEAAIRFLSDILKIQRTPSVAA